MKNQAREKSTWQTRLDQCTGVQSSRIFATWIFRV
uniref:Uncharacterized protein n=1 Tax=Siphoviridae sp. ctXQq5 TaxID=2826368 RepID=A0A8S5N142_9CAUD|nr:MAG TPA: hypothetical protein [Siphoviridae sp. ctXQq5]